jgi:RNA polymerase sigma-70 factor (ECF subfamily)
MTAPVTDITAARSERELVTRAASRDPAAQRDLYDRHVDRIYRVAFRLAGDDDAARDITQETFIRAFDRLGEFRHESSVGTWLHSIAVSVALGTLRSKSRRDKHHVSLDVAHNIGHEDNAADVDLREQLYAAIDALPVGYRTVFVMYEMEGYSHQEIARTLGVAETTSKGQLFRARAKLRESLKHFRGNQEVRDD